MAVTNYLIKAVRLFDFMVEVNNNSGRKLIKIAIIVFIVCAAALIFSGFDMIKSRFRDAERRANVATLVKALELYHDKYGVYPESADDWQGWDLSVNYIAGAPDFLSVLKEEGLTNRNVGDPVNDIFYNYRYRKYKAGEFGCPGAFYILQINNFELAVEDIGRGDCPDFNWAKTAPNGFTVQNFD